jgi:hypothetical protein
MWTERGKKGQRQTFKRTVRLKTTFGDSTEGSAEREAAITGL